MEKFSQFRDRGSGISPFVPTTTRRPLSWTLLHVLVFIFRLPLFLTYLLLYILVLHHLPLPAVARKLLLWGLLGIPGIWWVDLQLDGVKRGSLSQQPPSRVPHPGSVIAANFTSPLDALYLAAVFDPVFTISYPRSRRVRRVGLLRAVAHALSSAQLRSSAPPPTSAATTTTTTTDLPTLLRQNRDRIVVVFPECATTNGKAILPLAPALAHAPPGTVVFPLSVRYAPTDVTTPVPGWAAAGGFLWTLLSQPAHGVRVRIAEGMTAHGMEAGRAGAEGEVTAAEQKVLDRIAEALARLGRSRRVGLTVGDKARFVEAWMKKGKK